MAWGDPAKPFRPKDDDEDEGNPPQSVWRAQPLLFPIPFDTAAEAMEEALAILKKVELSSGTRNG